MHEWYMIPVRFEIVKIAQRHEFAFLKPSNIRALNLWKIDQMEKYFQLSNYATKRPNMYISVSSLKSIPIFTYQPSQRQKETSVWFRDKYFFEVYGYSIFFDFDKEESDSWESLLSEVKEFKSWLDEWKLPYEIIFSGNKGFHIIIPYEYLPDGLTFEVDDVGHGEKGSIYLWTKEFIEKCKEIFDLKMCDLANVGIPNRLRKLPYTLVGDNVVLPLNDTQLNNFRVEEMHWEKVKRFIRIKDRGTLLRKHNQTDKQLKENIIKFCKEFGIK